MIPSSERASERLTSILSNAEWVTRRNERGGDHYIARERVGRAREGDGDGAEREPRDGGERDEDGGRVRAAVQAGADDARDER